MSGISAPILFTSKHEIPIIAQGLYVTHIKSQPYSFVANVVKNITIPNNLTYVLPADPDDGEQELKYYLVIAFVIIAVVILSFCRGSNQHHRRQKYSSLPQRGGSAGRIQTVHLEEDQGDIQ